MPRHELNAERIMGEVQRGLQSNENVNLKDGMQVHLVDVGMPQGGVASRKRKHYGFKLSKFLDTKKSVIRIRNNDLLCLALALVTDMARQEKHPDWNSIRLGRQWESILANELHEKAGVPEGLCGPRNSSKPSKITRSLSYTLNTSMPLSLKGPRERGKFICIFAIITMMS